MHAHQLIGKLAIRTSAMESQVDINMLSVGVAVRQDWSYTTDPIRILAATEHHIVFEYPDNHVLSGKKYLLNILWVDDCWTDYEALMALATEEHIQLMQQLSGISPVSDVGS